MRVRQDGAFGDGVGIPADEAEGKPVTNGVSDALGFFLRS
jgi:hypothetical protein